MDEEKKPHLQVAQEMERQMVRDAWRDLMATESGRLIMWSILDKAGMFVFPHYGDSTDTLLRGRQQIGSELLNDYVFPNGVAAYTDLLLEAEARKQRLDVIAEQEARKEEEDEYS